MNHFRKSQNLVSQSRHCITHSLVLCHSQVRFLADPVCVKVVTISSIMSLFDTFLTEPQVRQYTVCAKSHFMLVLCACSRLVYTTNYACYFYCTYM